MKGLNSILLFIFCSFLLFQCKPNEQEFVKKGLPTKAKLAFKQEAITDSRLDYIFVVYFFTKDTLSSHDLHEHSLWKDSTLSLEEKIKKWNVIENEIGDFYSAEIFVDYDTFDSHKEGDVLDILYLPKDPHKAMLKENISQKK